MAFCVEFSRIREAAALYRHIKQLEAEDMAGEAALLQHVSNISLDIDESDTGG
jgi:hypothetical protein